MPRAIALRLDFTAAELARPGAAEQRRGSSPSPAGSAAIYDGGTRFEAALIGDVTLQIVRDWVVRFNAEGPDGLCDRKAPGPTPLLTDAHRQALAAQAGTPL